MQRSCGTSDKKCIAPVKRMERRMYWYFSWVCSGGRPRTSVGSRWNRSTEALPTDCWKKRDLTRSQPSQCVAQVQHSMALGANPWRVHTAASAAAASAASSASPNRDYSQDARRTGGCRTAAAGARCCSDRTLARTLDPRADRSGTPRAGLELGTVHGCRATRRKTAQIQAGRSIRRTAIAAAAESQAEVVAPGQVAGGVDPASEGLVQAGSRRGRSAAQASWPPSSLGPSGSMAAPAVP